MLRPFREIVEDERRAGTAVGAFTCYDVTTALGVIRAVEERRRPAVLLVSETSFRPPQGRLLVAALLAVAEAARVPMCVQLDHVSDDALVDDALAVGVGAVMADGSRLGPAANSAFVAGVRARAGAAGVEAELGHVEGDEDVAAAVEAGKLTDPEQAVAFVAETGCDCLAVSIGNVHGHYASAPALDWQRLQDIARTVLAPLSLHGASGLPPADLRRAVSLGICKVNVNTQIRERYFGILADHLPASSEGLRLLELERELVDGIAAAVDEMLEPLSPL